MKTRFLRMLNVRPEEFALAFVLWLVLGVNMIVQELSDVVATAGFVSNIGANQVPLLWIVTTLITIFAAAGYAMLVDRFPRLSLITWLMVGLALFYLMLQMLFFMGAPDWLTYPILYILADQQFAFLPLAFWSLSNDVYSMSEGKRIFPLLSSGSVIGGLAGNGLAALTGVLLQRSGGNPAMVFSLTAGLLITAVLILRLAFRKVQLRARQSREEKTSLRQSFELGLDYFANVPMLKAAGIAMIFVGITLTLVEFNFLHAIEQGVSSDLEFQTFFGIYKAVQMLGLLLFQWLITSRLLGKIPLKHAFLVLPIFLVLASGVAISWAGLIGSAVSRFLARTVYVGWDEPARKSMQGLIPDERRGRISTFMDSYFINFATLIGCVLLLVLVGCTALGWWSESTSRYIYLGVALLAGIGSLVSGLYLRRVYDSSLLNWRLSRSKRKSVLDGIDF